MSTKSLEIRVSPLVRKFLALHYPTAPFRLYAQNNPFAAFLLNALDQYPSKENFRQYQALTDKLTVSFSWSQIENQHYCQHFSQQKLIGFNDFVQQQFMQMTVREMVVRVETGERAIRAAEMILKRYKISEDELSLHTLLRYYRAYKDSINGQIKAAW